MTTNLPKNSKAFTLVETLIAIAILLVAVVGPIGLIGNAVHNLYYARDEMVAINLAQEGIEVVRQMRDSNMLSAGTWDFGFDGPNYVVDVGNATSQLSAITSDQVVYLDSTTGLYRQINNGYTPTQFSRLITTTNASLGTSERQITSTVKWRTGGSATGTISVSENLFKWAI